MRQDGAILREPEGEDPQGGPQREHDRPAHPLDVRDGRHGEQAGEEGEERDADAQRVVGGSGEGAPAQGAAHTFDQGRRPHAKLEDRGVRDPQGDQAGEEQAPAPPAAGLAQDEGRERDVAEQQAPEEDGAQARHVVRSLRRGVRRQPEDPRQENRDDLPHVEGV